MPKKLGSVPRHGASKAPKIEVPKGDGNLELPASHGRKIVHLGANSEQALTSFSGACLLFIVPVGLIKELEELRRVLLTVTRCRVEDLKLRDL